MEAKDDIRFVISGSSSSSQGTSSNLEKNASDSIILRVLTAVVGEDTAKDVVTNQRKVKEEEMEVEELQLSQEDRLLYGCCRSFFDDDSWAAAGGNLHHQGESKGVILPVCTEADGEPFWLFYTSQKVSSVLKSHAKTNIKGYWFDADDTTVGNYKLLHLNNDTISVTNVIKSEHGPIYYTHRMDVKAGQSFAIPDCFKAAVMTYV